MSPSTTHLWYLKIQPAAQQAFDQLMSAHKRAIFRHLKALLNSPDPYSQPFVEMLQGAQFERARKFRVGDYRVLFIIKPVPVEREGHTYKGTLVLFAILNRRDAYKG